jgi:hypothetical protein
MKMLAIVIASMVMLTVAAPAPASGSNPLTVALSSSPDWFYFADTVTVRVDVAYSRDQVDSRSVRLVTAFGPWQQLGPVRSSVSASGIAGHRTWWYNLACLSSACVPASTVVQPFNLPRVTVAARKLDGSRLVVHRAWPVLHMAGRIKPTTELEIVVPQFAVQTTVPPATYRIAVSPLALALDVIGAALFAIALAAGLREFFRWRASRNTSVDDQPPLLRTLALVRQAESRDPGDRRLAVGLLARTLPDQAGGLTSAASEVAWSVADPSSDRLNELVRTVEAQLEELS